MKDLLSAAFNVLKLVKNIKPYFKKFSRMYHKYMVYATGPQFKHNSFFHYITFTSLVQIMLHFWGFKFRGLLVYESLTANFFYKSTVFVSWATRFDYSYVREIAKIKFL